MINKLALPDSFRLNAWTGQAGAESPLEQRSWKGWAVRAHAAHEGNRIAQLLYAPETAPLTDWRNHRVGWGLVMADTQEYNDTDKAMAADAPQPIRDLLKSRPNSPVFRYRQEFNDLYLQIYRPDGTSNPIKIAGSERGVGRNCLPRYLLIYGNPEKVPWRLQFVLEAASFVGRLPEIELGNYVSSLISTWSSSECRRDSPVLWATDYGQDDITWLMRGGIAEPLRKRLSADEETKLNLKHLAGPDATRENLVKALQERNPAWIVTTSHGMTGPLGDKDGMLRDLGRLVDADRRLVHTASLLDKWSPDGAIWYAHACCSAGSEAGSNFEGLLTKGSTAERVVSEVGALGAKVAPFPRELLEAPKPARAFIGHVEPTFDWTLRDPETRQVLTLPICSALYDRLYVKNPPPIAAAFQDYYAQIGTLLSEWTELLRDRSSPDENTRKGAPERALRTKLNAVDCQSCVILGDPTVALPAFRG